MINFQKEEIYSERRKIILRTAERQDAKAYVYQCFPNIWQKEERKKVESELVQKIDRRKDGTSIVTILRKEDRKFIGFIYTEPADPHRSAIKVTDLVIPSEANRRTYAVDSMKQFVKLLAEKKLCETVLFEDKYESITAEKYIKDFLNYYDLHKLMTSDENK